MTLSRTHFGMAFTAFIHRYVSLGGVPLFDNSATPGNPGSTDKALNVDSWSSRLPRSLSTLIICSARPIFICLAMVVWSPPNLAQDSTCTGSCANATTFLRAGDVDRVIGQAAAEARARGRAATVAVVDRVGNVLAVYQDVGALATVTIRSGRFAAGPAPVPFAGGLEEAVVPSELAAISKAVTAAYLSSEGNAFSTRTASQIVQEFFNPNERGQPGGPLFGVQFSQLPCGDLVQQGERLGPGPRRSPLGLAADAGGLPLYMRGTPVGGIGVIVGAVYGADDSVQQPDNPEDLIDEIVALAGTTGYAAPTNRRADRITAGGLTLRFSDATERDVQSRGVAATPASALIAEGRGRLLAVAGFYPGTALRSGRAFGEMNSGVTAAAAVGDRRFNDLDAFLLVDAGGGNRFPPRAGAVSNNQRLTAADVTTVLREGLKIANRERAQIRQPSGSQARVTLSIVDTRGTVLGIARTRDAPVFGIDVSLQKARTAAFFTRPDAGARLSRLRPGLRAYADTVQAFVRGGARGRLLADGTALTPRAIGNLSRPFFPDGIPDSPHGPLSKPYQNSGEFVPGANEWSVFNVGLQLDMVLPDIGAILRGRNRTDCNRSNRAGIRPGSLANGLQIFPGGVPIYKNAVFVGAIGISGDGVDQDDMVAFLGVHNAGVATGGVLGNAPKAIRSDKVVVDTTGNRLTLRYVQCPVAPFIDSDEQRACGGK